MDLGFTILAGMLFAYIFEYTIRYIRPSDDMKKPTNGIKGLAFLVMISILYYANTIEVAKLRLELKQIKAEYNK